MGVSGIYGKRWCGSKWHRHEKSATTLFLHSRWPKRERRRRKSAFTTRSLKRIYSLRHKLHREWRILPTQVGGKEVSLSVEKEVQPNMGISSFDTLFQAAKSFFSSEADDTSREDAQSGFGMMDVSETDDAFVFYVDCPGMRKSDIDIRVNGNRMTITGTRIVEPVKEGCLYYSERTENTLNRETLLPNNVLLDSISSCYKDGVLVIQISKKCKDENRILRKIPVLSSLCSNKPLT